MPRKPIIPGRTYQVDNGVIVNLTQSNFETTPSVPKTKKKVTK